jgi:beta-lactamase regulating signal transducer with metallopeptidase domain
MNSWPTLKEWLQFGGVLALELVLVFALAKLVSMRARSVQWRRVVWQSAVVAMLLVTVGELNGVRSLLRPSAKSALIAPQRAVVITIKEPDLAVPRPPSHETAQPLPISRTGRSGSRWGQRTSWPALIWLAGLALVLSRSLLAQSLALFFRLSCRRVNDAALGGKAERICGVLGIRRLVTLIESARTVAPFTFGIWKPVIVLPRNFATAFTPEQLGVALAHELAHVAGFDSAWRCVSNFVCAALWWHPLAWLAKRELDHASELVADEASLLMADGPNRLAECLVACAKELRKPALVAWLGMDGGGFHSALGQRVARLLQLRSQEGLGRRVPWNVRIVAPAVCTVLVWIGIALIAKPQRGNDPGWRGSIIGSAMAAQAESAPAKTPTGIRSHANETNKAGLGLAPGANTSTNTNVDYTSVERQAVGDKLRQIRLWEFGPIDSLPLSEVIRQINDEARRRDPEKKGINFFLTPKAGRRPDTEVFDINGITIRLGMQLRDLTLEQVLQVVVIAADRPIQFSVEDYGVLITHRVSEREPLLTRFFRVDPNTFQQGLQNVMGFDAKSGRAAPALKTYNGTNGIISTLHALFKSAGANLSNEGKATFFNDRLGVLMVRASAQDLDVVEKAVQMLNMSPPQLTIDVKAMEIDAEAANRTFLQFGITNAHPASASSIHGASNLPLPTLSGILTEPQFRSVIRAMEKIGGTDLLSAPTVTTMSGRQAQIKVVDIRYVVTRLAYETNNPTGGTAPGVTVGTTNNGPLPVAEPFEIGPVVDVVPYVLADGYTIQMTVLPTLREFLGYDDPKTIWATGGPLASPDQQPTPLPKFRLRQVAATAMLYDGQTLVVGAGTTSNTAMDKQPDGTTATNYAGIAPEKVSDYKTISARLDTLRKRHLDLRAQYTDEHPVIKRVLEQIADSEQRKKYMEADNPKLLTLFAPQSVAPSTKALFFFITPRLIDPAGNRLHTDERLRELHKRVPEQRKAAE